MQAHVLLVNTNRIRPPIAPLALDYLGAALTAEGHAVRLLDLCMAGPPETAMRNAFRAARPDLVAVSFRNTDDCYFASGQSFHEVLKNDVALLRAHYDGPIVVGGCGFSLMPVRLLELCGADYGVCGDGEPALSALLQTVLAGGAMSNVPGLVWQENGAWRRNGRAQADLDSLRLGARALVDNRAYFEQGGQSGIETKRGCPGQCIYCADPVIKGATLRARPLDDVVAECRALLDTGIDHLHLCDSEFNIPESHALALCQTLSDKGLGRKLRWYAYAAPMPFPAELAQAARRAGCVGINFGADSACKRMLRRLGRNYDCAQLAATVKACREAGIVCMYDLLLGAPGETRQSVRETIETMKRIGPDRVGISLGVRVYPGTPLARELTREPVPDGLTGDPDGLEPAFYMSPELGDEPTAFVRERIGGDERFLLPVGKDAQDYNYNDNTVLEEAIESGHRGAYWDILRRLRSAS